MKEQKFSSSVPKRRGDERKVRRRNRSRKILNFKYLEKNFHRNAETKFQSAAKKWFEVFAVSAINPTETMRQTIALIQQFRFQPARKDFL